MPGENNDEPDFEKITLAKLIIVNSPSSSWASIKMQQMANGRFMKSEIFSDASVGISESFDFTSVYAHVNFESSC